MSRPDAVPADAIRSAPRPETAPALDLRGVDHALSGRRRPVTIVDDVSLSVRPGETLAVVGESGSGKTMDVPQRHRPRPRAGAGDLRPGAAGRHGPADPVARSSCACAAARACRWCSRTR